MEASSMRLQESLKKLIYLPAKAMWLAALSITLVTISAYAPVALAQSAEDLESLYYGSPLYDPESGGCAVATVPGLNSNSVYVLGDSITNSARTNVSTELIGAGYAVTAINADPGRAISVDTAGSNPPGLQAVLDDENHISNSSVIVIALGTNSGTEDLNVQIPALLANIRGINPNARIYWVNLFYTSDTAGRDARNEIITSLATSSGYSVIDTTGANIELGSDAIHPTNTGNNTFATVIANALRPSASETPGAAGDVPEDGIPSHVLTYPGIVDEAAAAQAINTYISSRWSSSPFVGLGEAFIRGAKRSNVNPFLAVGHLQRENGFATAASGWHATTPPSYNAFGRSASQSQPHTTYTTSSGRVRLVYQWPSWEASLDGEPTGSDDWFMAIRRNYLNAGSPYESHDFTTYISHYAPGSDGNDEQAYINGLYATIDAVTQGLVITGSGLSTTPGGCIATGPGGNPGANPGQVNIDGYAFPLAPQTQAVGGIRVGQTTTGHHDGTPAYDLFSTDSADVYAIYDGTPVTINTNYKGVAGCSTIQFRAEDGYYYWYGHLKNVTVTQGARVAAGTKIAEIADRQNFTSVCWGGGPHLHIDRGCTIGGVPQRGGRDECRDPAFISFLAQIYATLPAR